MRKLLLLSAAALLVAGCARPSEYPSDEVLRRSAAVSQTLASSTFTGDGTLSVEGEGSTQSYGFTLEGTLQNAGHQTQLALVIDGNIQAADQMFDVSGALDIISLSPSEVYMRVQDVKSTPEFPLLSGDLLRNFIGQWWLLSGTGTVVDSQEQLSPDPSLLRLQSEVVKVTQDHGIQRRDGHDVYVYDVTVSQSEFQQFLKRLAPTAASDTETAAFLGQYDATGTLEIDVESFYVRRVTWHLQPKPDAEQRMSLSFDLQFQNQNNAPRIQAPEGAKPFRSPLMPEPASASSIGDTSSAASSQR